MPKGNLSFDAKAIQYLMPSAIRAANKFLIPKDQINNSRSDQILNCAASNSAGIKSCIPAGIKFATRSNSVRIKFSIA
jgi:hypothetical protein